MRNQTAASERAFDALGEPVRRRILEVLSQGPTPVGALATQLPVGRPAVSKHLRVLSEAGLIEHSSVGTRNLYSLAPAGLDAVHDWLSYTWDVALQSFASAVSAEASSRSRSGSPLKIQPRTQPRTKGSR